MLRFLQEELPRIWTQELYSKQFRESPSQYKDFDHTLKHAMKAAVMLQNMVEEADHQQTTVHTAVYFPPADVEKYVADLVICAVRLAIKNPSGAFNLEKAVFDRIEKKMGVKLAQ